jgi:hypothetical protein
MERGKATFILGDATRLPLADKSVDLTFCSPPYADARTYGIGAQRNAAEWVEWMLQVVKEAVRVTNGLVLVNCAGVTRDWCYWPSCEGLLWEWYKQGGRCWRPAFWHRVGIPGSGGKQWLRADIEYVLCFTDCKGKIPWSDNTANGHPPKWAPGGEMSYRLPDGTRTNQWGKTGSETGTTVSDLEKAEIGTPRPSHESKTKRDWQVASGKGLTGGSPSRLSTREHQPSKKSRHEKLDHGAKPHTKSCADGSDVEQVYLPPLKANPGNLIQGITVGGGQMGHKLAHENEAPFPVKLAQWFIKSHCPPAGTVLDPFSGSGTTAQAAVELGRNAIGLDIRQSQIDLALRRMASLEPIPESLPLFDHPAA